MLMLSLQHPNLFLRKYLIILIILSEIKYVKYIWKIEY